MDATVRATCPKCRNILRIPAQWVGQAVKCKKCGSVVRSKAKDGSDAAGTGEAQGTAEAVPLDQTPRPQNGQQVPGGNAFDFSQPSADDDFPLLPEPLVPPGPEVDDRFDPTGGADAAAQPAPQPVPGVPPGYPYPLPPGYPPPGYGPPPGYPYAPPPGYPYPLPPGYGPPPGYPYPLPPGYPPGYGVPPGYPYAPPPGMVPPADANAAGAAHPQAPGPCRPARFPIRTPLRTLRQQRQSQPRCRPRPGLPPQGLPVPDR